MSELEWNGTFNCLRNSYSNAKNTEKNPHGVRIDHILYKPGQNTTVSMVLFYLSQKM